MTRVLRVSAAAKVNLALAVGPPRQDGMHELCSIVQRIDVCDRLELAPADELAVDGFPQDTLVRAALTRLAEAAGVEPRWRLRLEKGIPVAAGLGGGSADAAAALQLANQALGEPLSLERLLEIALTIGSDVPFFVEPGPKLMEGVGERLTPLDLPQDFWVMLALEPGVTKASTGAVYARFDQLAGGDGFDERRDAVRRIALTCRRARDLGALPRNDLARAAGVSDLPERLRALGSFHADLSGAGPTVFGLFHHRHDAVAAASRLPAGTRSRVVAAVW